MKPALGFDPVALLRPKGKSNREHKLDLRRKAIVRLLDQFGRRGRTGRGRDGVVDTGPGERACQGVGGLIFCVLRS